MTKLYLIRHAEAEGNLYRRVHGWYNSMITPNGMAQIEALSRRFADIPVDAVYSSDLRRTCTTAQSVYVPKGLELRTMPGLREIHFGEWEDVTWGDLDHIAGVHLESFIRNATEYQSPGGENFETLRTRMHDAIFEIAKNHPDETVAVFSHGCAIRNLLSLVQGYSTDETSKIPHCENTAVALLEIEGDQANVVFFNDASHITEEISTLGRQNWWRGEGEAPMKDVRLRFVPLNLEENRDLYLQFRKEGFASIRGEDFPYDPAAHLEDAMAQWQHKPNSIFCAYHEDAVAGLVQIDMTQTGDIGVVPFVYLTPQYRKQRLGVQLLGQAISTLRDEGYQAIRLRCAPDNQVAQKFYRRNGFQTMGMVEDAVVPMEWLEKEI